MQETLLDILILGLLVLVFGAIQRRRAVPRIRYWTLGWVCALFHFTVLAALPDSNLQSILALSALVLTGCCFLLASSHAIRRRADALLAGGLLALPALCYLCLTIYGVATAPVLMAVSLVGELSILYLALRYWSADRVLLRATAASALATIGWVGLEIYHKQSDVGIYAFLTQLFFLNGLLYWRDFRRNSSGVMTAVLGLFAWAAVFPAAISTAILWPKAAIPGELWNIPKYFVEFGMILTLLEDEITAASRQSEEYRVLFENNPHPMWIFDTQTLRFLRVNDAAVANYGYAEEEFLQMTLRDIRCPEDRPRLLQDVTLSREPLTFSGPWTHVRKDGSQFQVEIASHTILFQGKTAHFSLLKDVTEREELHQQLFYQAHHDLLTGLPNRLLLKERMQQTLARAARYDRLVAFLCIDLDRFKQINDTYGHLIGDLCLRQVAERLRARLRTEDTIARSGGEEFVILVSDLTSREDAQRVAAEILDIFRKPFLAEGYQLDVPASMGAALYPDDGAEAGELWRNADVAMYRAKKSGGNQCIFVSDEISSAASEANDLELFMRRALSEGGFELLYQPQCTPSGQLSGLEALLRLHHPRLGLVMPDRFIPIAEESGLILPIGNWVLDEVARQSMAWTRSGMAPIRIAINVSPLQFMHSDFLTQVQQVLMQSGMPPALLEIEVTETTVMRNLEDVARQMRELAVLGVHFSVDDFGTGYSSLRHLHQLPIKTLKIDRSFIERIAEPDGTYSIVQAILSLAHSLEMQVVAEGVERREQVEALQAMGCDLFQGFLFSPPVPAASVPQLLGDHTLAAWLREPVTTQLS